jgi:branched-chain amino acid transport system ATP-binding protein
MPEILKEKKKEHTHDLLLVDRISLNFGGLQALIDTSLTINHSGIFAIIGPNGAGKTCLLNCINGFYRPSSGSIFFHGQNIDRLPVHERTRLGLARTFQNIELFSGLTTLENILAGRQIHLKYGVMRGSLFFGPALKEEVTNREIVEQIIDFLEIKPIRNKVVGTLPYGLRKRVELGRALAIEPRLLLLDEPMSGMNMEEKEDMARFIIDIYEERDIPIILIEHDMGVVMDISDRVSVFDFGRKIAEGTPMEIAANEKVIKAYLGE